MARAAGQAKIRHETALAEEAEQRSSESKRLTSAMSTVGKNPAQGDSLADVLESQALQLSNLGFPTKAGALGAQAATMRLKEAQQGQVESAASKLDYDVKSKMLDRISNLYGSATDAKGWAAANMFVAEQFPEFENPLAQVPFSPENAKAAAAQATSMKDKLTLKLQQQKLASEDRLRSAREKYLGTRSELLERQVADRERRTEILEKNGGKAGKDKPVGSPATGDVKAASALLKSSFPDLPKGEVANAAFQIASEAKRLAKQNPGLSMGDAMTRAFTAAQADGDFETKSSYLGMSKSTKYNAGGKSAQTALPATRETKFQEGRFYNTPKGVMQYKGGKWFEVAAPSAGGVPGGDDIDDEEGDK